MDPLRIAGLFVLLGFSIFVMGIRKRPNFPRGRIIYIDSGQLTHKPDTLYDPKTGLAGRPDYLIQGWRSAIPVELKSSPAPTQPHDGHILQLAAYCHLVETTLGRRPPYGVIRYPDESFRVDYSRALRQNLHRMVDRIRTMRHAVPDRSHKLAARCRACGFQAHCDQALE